MHSKVEKKVLKKVKPTPKEQEKMESFRSDLLEVAGKVAKGYKAKPIIVGSTGRGTWLKGSHDIDLFLVFPRSLSRKKLEKNGLAMGKKIGKKLKARTKVKYAEHPYTRLDKKGFDVDIVPCYKMKPQQDLKSAVDRSPLHAKYLEKELEEDMKDEVRLLKAFARGQGIYGSDARTQGMSGYLCELLVIRYGDFRRTLKQISKWKPQVYIDLEGYWEKRPEFKGPLVVIDPVDHDRNVAAVMTTENFMKLVETAKSYLEKPSLKYFFPRKKPMTYRQFLKLLRRETVFIALTFKKPDVIEDILWPQMRKAARRLEGVMKDEEFRPVNHLVWADGRCVLFFELEEDRLPKIREHQGPPANVLDRSKEFRKKYKKYEPRIEGKRWVVDVPRKHRTVMSLLKNFKNQSVKKLKEQGVPNYIAPKFKRARILKGRKIWPFIKKNPEFGLDLKDYY